MALRIKGFLQYLGRKSGYVLAQPTFLQIEPTTRCNFACSFCGRKEFSSVSRDMSMEDFRRIINQFPKLTSVTIQGFGEPLLNPALPQMIRYVKEKLGANVLFFSNGSLLCPTVCEELVDTGLDLIIISFDGASARTFEHVRKGANFEQICKGIECLIEIRKRKGTNNPRITLHTTCMRDNLKELPAILELGDRLMVDGIGFHPLLATDVTKMSNSEQLLSHVKERFQVRATIETLKQLKKESKLDVVISDELLLIAQDQDLGLGTVNEEIIEYRRYCKWPWEGCSVSVTGEVLPCCYAPYFLSVKGKDSFSPEPLSLLDRPFDQIWNDQAYRMLRIGIARGRPTRLCESCHLIQKNPRFGVW